MTSSSQGTIPAYASHHTTSSSAPPAVITLSALGRYASALDLTAIDPPSQINDTAPYTYHRRNSSYSSNASRGTSTASEVHSRARFAAPLTPPLLSSRTTDAHPLETASSRPSRSASSRQKANPPVQPSLLNSAYSNVPWWNAATPSSGYHSDAREDGLGEAAQGGLAIPIPQSLRQETSLDVRQRTSSPTPRAPPSLLSLPPSSLSPSLSPDQDEGVSVCETRLPLTGCASESVSELEAQFAMALQQLDVCQRMNRKLENHNSVLETELHTLGQLVTRLHRTYHGHLRQSIAQLKADCAGLNAYVQLALTDYQHGLQQTEKAIVQLLVNGQPNARHLLASPFTSSASQPSPPPSSTQATLTALALSLPPADRTSVCGPASPYRPGEWMTGLSMYNKGNIKTEEETAAAYEESRYDDGEVEVGEAYRDGAEPTPRALLEAVPFTALVDAAQGTARREAKRREETALGSTTNTSYGDEGGAALARSEEPEESIYPDPPHAISLDAYRRLQLAHAACQRRLVVTEGKYRVWRADMDAHIAQLQEAHAARVQTLEKELKALRAGRGDAGVKPALIERAATGERMTAAPELALSPTSTSPPSQQFSQPKRSAGAAVMRAPDRLYPHSTRPTEASYVERSQEEDEDEEEYEEDYGEDESALTESRAQSYTTESLNQYAVTHFARRSGQRRHGRAPREGFHSTSQPVGLNESSLSDSERERGGVGSTTASGTTHRVAQGLWAEQLLARRHGEQRLHRNIRSH